MSKTDFVHLSDLHQDPDNARLHNERNYAAINASIAETGFGRSLLAASDGTLIAGNATAEVLADLDMTQVIVVESDGTKPIVHKRTDIAPGSEMFRKAAFYDNRAAELASGWDTEVLAALMQEVDIAAVAMTPEEAADLIAADGTGQGTEGLTDPDEVPEPPVEPTTRLGDIWRLGDHRVMCGDCRDFGHVQRLFDGYQANVVVTSPPYASQRAYDPSSGFKPIAPDDYVAWFRDVAANIMAVLDIQGSYFLNIKEHADGGQRSLYVKDLTLAHVREWGWMFVDEFCWRNTRDGVPGGWNNRFKNGWEPVFHFTKSSGIKFRPDAVSHASQDAFEYSAKNAKSPSGSGLLGSYRENGKHGGMARPSNVIEAAAEVSQAEHSAPFPVALPSFFLRAFSDTGDIVFDPFMGSGTTLIAAEQEGRVGYGTEISPAYCDVIVRRWEQFTGGTAELERAIGRIP